MKDFISEFSPIWSAGFIGGIAIGVITFAWTYLTIQPP